MNCKLFIFSLSVFSSTLINAQDTIVKKNGTIIPAKIIEVGTNAISYKKWKYLEGPTFVENKSELVYIKYKDGQIDEFLDSPNSLNNKAVLDTNKTKVTNTDQQKAKEGSRKDSSLTQSKNKIEAVDGKYTINGQKAKLKDVNRLLEKSKNPAILVPLKVAKTTSMFQKIVKITSIPTTIGGGGALLWTGIDMYNDIRRGRDNTSTYVGAFSSLLTTITFPITNKILKKKSNKMYNTLIDIYNVTN